MELLERGAFLESLEGWLAAARSGEGCMVLLGGEAGIGKTALARAFCDRHGADARVLWGACDALRTPRPLGPLLDITREVGGELARLVSAEPTRHRLFGAFLDLLGSAGAPDAPGPRALPVVAVVEDAHWADEATLDLLVFLGRRVADSPAVVLVTYRDDEVGRGTRCGRSSATWRLPTSTAAPTVTSSVSSLAARRLIPLLGVPPPNRGLVVASSAPAT